ncbi:MULTISPECIES: MBL fold metallo-hydrolase [Pacificibacter]|uniref:MBL fold metallo-hydrolase n=1 Tax=Pacificibacter TaxID=1042323 RepID=UPI001C09E26A|nr:MULTISPECIES: MBL fold metallo-hydrolase [Pacificibacter]MBU2937155.1 MBL fold metallo-hydrolase [Pacificibacter marinus]MDO6617025.1 MBL fold metallo-hydrolase [Pacificibacter sp. 1_MG-2023]
MNIDCVDGFPTKGEAGLYWLGQAGFWIETGRYSILIDPYLSDSLARKYAGKKHPHIRMAPAPISVEDLPKPDLVLITHAHTDHMDPDTLGPLYDRFPDLAFMVPAACEDAARERINPRANLILVDSNQELSPLAELTIVTFPAAHEDLKRNAEGAHFYLGYGIKCPTFSLYHSGDSIPFEGLQGRVETFAPDIALLPVNGRDAQRLHDGIPGNFTFSEAASLARTVPILVPHHFGMFDFNTISDAQIENELARSSHPHVAVPVLGQTMRLRGTG